MADELTPTILDALVEKEHERALLALNRLSTQSQQYGPGTFEVFEGVIKRMFEDRGMAPYFVPHLLSDMVDREGETSRLQRYKTMVHFLGSTVNFMSSTPANLFLSNLTFVRDGVDIGIVDTDGKKVMFSADYVKDSAIKILDDSEALARVAARYARGFRDAFRAANKRGGVQAGYDEAIDVETFVRDERAELYSLIRMLAPGTSMHRDLPMDQEDLMERYERFAKKYITGSRAASGEFSYFANQPIELIVQTAKAAVHIVGNSDHWSGIIRLGFQPTSYVHDVMDILRKALGVDEELRKDVHTATNQGSEWVEQGALLAKQAANLVGHEVYRRHTHIMTTLGKRDIQREIVERYAPPL